MIDGGRLFPRDTVFHICLAFSVPEWLIISQNPDLSHRMIKSFGGSCYEANYWRGWPHKKWAIERSKILNRSA